MNIQMCTQYMKNQNGSVLIALLIFMVVGITVATTAVMIVVDATVGVSQQQTGNLALDIAESGAEIAILSLLRDPQYTGEVIAVGEGTATVSVSGENPYTVRSVGAAYEGTRIIEVVVARDQGRWVVQEWHEVE